MRKKNFLILYFPYQPGREGARVSASFESGPMIRISVPSLVAFAQALEMIPGLPSGTVKLREVHPTLGVIKGALYSFYGRTSVFKEHVRASSVATRYLDMSIDAVLNIHDLEADVPEAAIRQVKDVYAGCRQVIISDLEILDVYFITQKPPYSIQFLLNSGESLFPGDLAAKVPEALFDAQQAAKCLAFELPTACGFHLFRVVESVLRRYYAASGGRALTKTRSLGVYINAMTQRNVGDQKVLSALKQMADLHRNPLIHPDTVLTMDEVQATIGMARSVASLMLGALPPVPPTTTTAPASSP